MNINRLDQMQYNSNFLGIGEGKRKKVVEEEKRKTAELNANLQIKTAGVEAQKNAAALALEQLKLSSTNNMYVAFAVVVLILMGGLFFMFKK